MGPQKGPKVFKEGSMAVVAVFNQKGGVGKTTTCLNLAGALWRSGRRVLGIDLDPQSHLTLSAGVQVVRGGGVAAYFRDRVALIRLLQSTSAGWPLLPATPELSKIDALYGSDPQVASRLRQGLTEEFKRQGDPILIDCCPMLGVLTLNALLAADRVLIPVSADYLSLQGVERLEVALKVLEQRQKRSFLRRIVVTRFDGRRRLCFEVEQTLRRRYGEIVCKTMVYENAGLATSPAHGQDVFQFAPQSGGAADHGALAKELIENGFIDSAVPNDTHPLV